GGAAGGVLGHPDLPESVLHGGASSTHRSTLLHRTSSIQSNVRSIIQQGRLSSVSQSLG
ncbi:unnamed protein product, partial [Polarella glacialis]